MLFIVINWDKGFCGSEQTKNCEKIKGGVVHWN